MTTRAVVCLVLVALLLAPAGAAVAAPEVERVAGPDRVATSVAAAQAGWDTAETAVVATAADFPDALAASTLASAHDAPLLLTRQASLPDAVGAELERLGVQRVLVPGGDSAVGHDAVEQLEALSTAPEVERLAGESRFETAAAIAAEVGAASDAEEAIVVVGDDFADALSAGAFGLADPLLPLLLAEHDQVPDASREVLAELGVDRVLLVGGTAALSDAVEADLQGAGYDTERLAGGDRYWTSAAVAGELASRGVTPDGVALATGAAFPDALAAAPLAARLGSLLHLAAPAQPHEPNDQLLRERADRWASAMVLGGPSALSEDVRASLGRSLRAEPHPEPDPEPQYEQASTPTPAEIAVDTARQQLGKPYRYGGNGPGSFDCSGLTSFAWRAAGVEIPRVSRNQFASLPRVPDGERQPGDLVAFGSPVHHIGIYIGDGKMIDAPHSGTTVRISSIHRANRRGFVRPR